MIAKHSFDSTWRGQPVGIVEDASLLDRNPDEIRDLCKAYEWVEFRSPATSPVPIRSLAASGFVKLDTQIDFRIDFVESPPEPVPGLQVTTFAELGTDPDLSAAKPFMHERFARLPGVDDESLNRRYTLWANDLCREAPDWCVGVKRDSQVQGWYFSRLSPDGNLNLTLGAASKDSQISGTDLYRAAFARYFEAGAKVGSASFSVRNFAAMNIYSSLGARFTGATDFWLRSPAWADD